MMDYLAQELRPQPKGIGRPVLSRTGTPAEARKSLARKWVGLILREPFLHFILIGLLIWAGVEYRSGDYGRYTIHVGTTEQQGIAINYLRQYGQLPAPAELRQLVDLYIRQEICLHEGLRLGLDKGDEIVRRRIIQKYEFLLNDIAVPDAPRPETLQRWFERHKQNYLTAERVDFDHVYFSPDKGGWAGARSRAVDVLQAVHAGRRTLRANSGDTFPGPSQDTVSREEANRIFGQSELADALFMLAVGSWAGPYRSDYGWHLVYVTERSSPVLPSLMQIHEQVLANYLEEQRSISNARAFEKVRAKYSVIVDRGAR